MAQFGLDAFLQPVPNAAVAASTTARSPGTADLLDQIRQLGELHRDGLLTDEEFAAMKRQLLAGEATA